MNFGKEAILAIIAGFAIGLLAAWGIWSYTLKNQKQPPVVNQPQQTPMIKEKFILTLAYPEDKVILGDSSASVSGTVSHPATVVINGPKEDQAIEAQENFQTLISLEEGENEIIITAYPKNQNLEKQTEARTVNYTKEEF